MRASGLFAPFRLANRSKALILMYHRFGQVCDGVSARAFEEQLDYLQSRYEVVPLSFVSDLLARGRSLPPRLAVITIDDGYRDVYEVALPILKRRGLPATLFVATGFVDGDTWLWTDKLRYLSSQAELAAVVPRSDGRHRPAGGEAAALINSRLKRIPDESKEETIKRLAAELAVAIPKRPPAEFAPLSWQQIKELDGAGVEIGSHTVTHPILTNIDSHRLAREISESRSRLQSMLGRDVNLFCYPNGDFDTEVRREVERAGYACAVTTQYGFNDCGSDVLTLRRIPAAPDLAHFVQSTSGFEQFRMKFMRAGASASLLSWAIS
jgi:peptidoglycan/xylan/chitin deacetylase (PgdA/CDA1 family)